MTELNYLQPKLFTVDAGGFIYEVIAFKEYFEEENGLEPTGNLSVNVLTPHGIEQFTLTAEGEVWHSDEENVKTDDAFEYPEVFDQLADSGSDITFNHPYLPEDVFTAIKEKLK